MAVIAPAGEVIAELPVPGKNPTNVDFWEDSLYVTETETGAVYRLEIGVEGQPLFRIGLSLERPSNAGRLRQAQMDA